MGIPDILFRLSCYPFNYEGKPNLLWEFHMFSIVVHVILLIMRVNQTYYGNSRYFLSSFIFMIPVINKEMTISDTPLATLHISAKEL